jgi:hypothetical protein
MFPRPIGGRVEEDEMTKAKSETAVAEAQPETLFKQTTDHPVDRSGCDFGGSTRNTTAGLSLGLGDDAF